MAVKLFSAIFSLLSVSILFMDQSPCTLVYYYSANNLNYSYNASLDELENIFFRIFDVKSYDPEV